MDQVDVWAVRLDGVFGDPAAVLTSDEEQRAARFVRDVDGRRFRVARARLRQLLAAYWPPAHRPLGSGEQLTFVANEYAKPALLGFGAPQFNLSHSADVAVIAIHPQRDVGIDVEASVPGADLMSVAARVLTESELGSLRGALRPRDVFLRFWCRKEALLKAMGCGFRRDPRSVSVDEAPGGADSDGARRAIFRSGGDDWHLLDFDLPGQYFGAVCLRGRAPDVRLRWLPQEIGFESLCLQKLTVGFPA